MKIAIYVRVSTTDQTIDQQLQPLINYAKNEGLEFDIFIDKTSGSKQSRPDLDRLMYGVRSKLYNKILVYKLDRLGRSLKHLIQLMEEFNNKGVEFVCLSPSINTKDASGRFFFQIIGAVAELEREMIKERTTLKLKHLKEKGIILGRPKGSNDKTPRKRFGYFQRHAKKTTLTKINEIMV